MPFYATTPANVDLESLELMCLHIVNCRMFKNQTISLNAKYAFSFEEDKNHPVLIINKNNEHVDLFEDMKINLTVVCGENGSGKTTLLNILQGKERSDDSKYYVVFKDKDDHFFSNEKLQIKFCGKIQDLTKNDMRDYKLKSVACANSADEVEKFYISKGIANSYHSFPQLFDFEDHELFTHFQIDFFEVSDNSELISDHLQRELNFECNSYDIKKISQEHPLLYLLMHLSQDSTFEDEFIKLRNEISSVEELCKQWMNKCGKDFNDIDRKLRKMMSAKDSETPSEITGNDSSSLFTDNYIPKEYEFNDYLTVYENIKKLNCEITDMLEKTFEDIHIDSTILDSLLFFNMFRKDKVTGKRFLKDLSSGEYMSIRHKYYLAPRMAQLEGCWIAEDETDKDLHPEWKRTFLSTYINAVQETRKHLQKVKDNYEKYSNKVYSFVITTHSPFLLSDLPSSQIVFLEKNGFGSSIAKIMPNRTFAGNIGQMFYENFFMSQTIGQFAKNKIEEILKELNSSKTISSEKKDSFEKVCDLIADDLLRNLLSDRINQAKIKP